jgi:hypothetical protein
MGLRTFSAALFRTLLLVVLAAPFAAAQDEAFVAAFVLAIFVLPVGVRVVLCWWIYNDAHRRGKSSAIWIVVVILSPLIGAVLWWLERDRPLAVYPAYYYPPPYYAYAPGPAPPAYAYPHGPAPPASPGGFRPSVSCRRCGVQMPLGSLFCPSCGARQK